MQPDLFQSSARASMPLARHSDPATSHQAAAQAVQLAADQHIVILAALGRGPAGADGIAARCRLSGHQVLKRMSELERMGLARLTGKVVLSTSGRQQREWSAV